MRGLKLSLGFSAVLCILTFITSVFVIIWFDYDILAFKWLVSSVFTFVVVVGMYSLLEGDKH